MMARKKIGKVATVIGNLGEAARTAWIKRLREYRVRRIDGPGKELGAVIAKRRPPKHQLFWGGSTSDTEPDTIYALDVDGADLIRRKLRLARKFRAAGRSVNWIEGELHLPRGACAAWVRIGVLEGDESRKEAILPRVLDLRKIGYSYKTIGAEVGLHPSTVSKWCREAGPEYAARRRTKKET